MFSGASRDPPQSIIRYPALAQPGRMNVYYLTVQRGRVDVIRRQAFADYAEAVAFTSRYYQVKPPVGRAVLKFTTEAINGEFARSYATVTRVQDVTQDRPFFAEARHAAVKQENCFAFDAPYVFLIESQLGRDDQEAEAAEGEYAAEASR